MGRRCRHVPLFGISSLGGLRMGQLNRNIASNDGSLSRQNKPTVEDRFGSWMQVASRKCRQNMVRKNVVQDILASNEGFQFNVLVVEDGEDQQGHAPITQLPINVEPRIVEPSSLHQGTIASTSHSPP
ncbi:hypothetical protein V6N11_083583 [Hibiscus sabdariffa]|uniref:Uncharacterized protein n=1 Tax=Hibiscus sabdariffa TaxID=183260 RepID=A0ABR2QC26_9ROSI